MEIAICGPAERTLEFANAGLAWIELPASGLLHESPVLPPGLRCQSTNLFFPGSVNLAADYGAAIAIGKQVIDAANQIGVKTMVVGSGNQRRSSQNDEHLVGEKRFLKAVLELQNYALHWGIKLAPESLRVEETNVFNYLGPLFEGLSGTPAGVTADVYHIASAFKRAQQGGDHPYPPDATKCFDHWLAYEVPSCPHHVHFADVARTMAVDSCPFALSFLTRLHQLGYKGLISLEGAIPTFADVQQALGSAKRAIDYAFGSSL